MSRYLTPSKIGLLALISLYAENVVPTVASIPVLSFVVAHLLPATSLGHLSSNSSTEHSFSITIEDFQRATITHASGIPGRTIWDLVLKKLWEINSLDALHVIFDSLTSISQKPREELQGEVKNSGSPEQHRGSFSRTSLLGTFVRRAQLEFTRLQLHDGVLLWKSFVTYREPTLPMWRRRNPSAGNTSFDANLIGGHFGLGHKMVTLLYGDLADENHKEARISTTDVEKLLEFQIYQMQSILLCGILFVGALPLMVVLGTGNRIPDGMKKVFQEMVKTGVTVPSLSHYVKCVASL